MTERQRLLNEQNSNSRYYQRCHNKLSYLTQQEKTQFEKLKKAWKKHGKSMTLKQSLRLQVT